MLVFSSGRFYTSTQKLLSFLQWCVVKACGRRQEDEREMTRISSTLVLLSLLISAHPASVCDHNKPHRVWKHAQTFREFHSDRINFWLRIPTLHAYASLCKWVIRESRATWMFRLEKTTFFHYYLSAQLFSKYGMYYNAHTYLFMGEQIVDLAILWKALHDHGKQVTRHLWIH